jgi:hypothetical protein
VSQTSDPAAPIRVAIVGYGLGSAAFHAPFVWTIAGLERSAIVTRDAKRQEQVKRDYPGVKIIANVDDLWKPSTGIDVVVISTPNRTHVRLALAAIEAGLHVVVDKPLAPSAREARAVAEAAELDRRRPGVDADDDSFVALTHASGLRSHLYMSVVSAQLAPRFRLLGDTAAYTKWGLDVQEDDEAPPPVAIADAIAALEVIEAARASVEQTTVIRL